MGRKVGNFKNPQTGENDWLEPDSVEMILLQSKMVQSSNGLKTDDIINNPIDFKLGNIDVEEVITLKAEYQNNNTFYSSDVIKMKEEDFAKALANATYSGEVIDSSKLIIEAKEKAIESLSKKLLDQGIIIGEMYFQGFGFVMANNEKLMTIESIEYKQNVQKNNSYNEKIIKTAKIKDCVSLASLNNIENFEIVFYTGTHKIKITNCEVTSSSEGKIKNYEMSIENIEIDKDDTMPEHDTYEELKYEDEEFMNDFFINRNALLDNKTEDDDMMESRFDDLF